MTVLDADGRTWAAVPFRGRSGKRRLAGLLDDDERGRLVYALLGDVLAALLAVPAIERVLVVAPVSVELPEPVDGRGASLPGADERVAVLPERADEGDARTGLNPALVRAQAVAVEAGVDRLLIVPADLPLLRPADVAAVLGQAAALPTGQGVVIAPDAAATGTNAVLLAPPDALSPQFGVGSYRAHLAQADSRGLPRVTVRRPSLSLDLDTPADVARLLAVGPGAVGRTAALARALQLGDRLRAVAARR